MTKAMFIALSVMWVSVFYTNCAPNHAHARVTIHKSR